MFFWRWREWSGTWCQGGIRRDEYARYLRYSSSRLVQCMKGLIDSILLTDRDKMVALVRNCTMETSCSLLPHKFNDFTDDNESHFDFSRMFSSVKARDILILVLLSLCVGWVRREELDAPRTLSGI